jgi:IS30 family transposase
MDFSIEEVNNINNRLANGESIRSISTDLKLNKSTISDLFKKNGYNYNASTRQYVSSEAKPTIQTKIVANKTSLVRDDIFKIPAKTKKKTETKAFNVVMKLSLVDKIDTIAKSKGYSRNQIINLMCDIFVDNME